MKRIQLALAIHNHQPVGNFDFVFADAYTRAYLPMLELIERHPSIKLTLHYTGPLRDWLDANHHDFLDRIRVLVTRRQVEVMTGGYYEPILAAIPDADKRGQIQKLTRAVERDFGYVARGAWLAERVWEPSLAQPLAHAGVEYTIVDDTHFKYVGLDDKDLFGYYVTEEEGDTLKIYGTSKHLRYAIPWAPVQDVIAWLREEASEDKSRVAVMGDDGEKFGLWPGTYEHCWGKRDKAQEPNPNRGWMEEFFRALEANHDWLETTTLAEYTRKFPALGRIYLPTASYDEMTEWALPAKLSGDLTRLKHQLETEGRDDLLRFVKGAFWRNFLIKYPEANGLHKKMLGVSEKLAQVNDQLSVASAQSPAVREQAPVSLLAQARDHLYAGQCNCPYWHGVFGGIYLPHIRAANYEHLIQAEKLLDQIEHGRREWVDWQVSDFDKDSVDELLVSGSAMNLYFDLSRGGALFEWDWRAKGLNLLNTLSRREEGYHRDLVEAAAQGAILLPGDEQKKTETIHSRAARAKEPGLEKQLNYDWYRRVGLIDHFLHENTTLDDFARARYGEAGDFVNQEYKAKVKSAKPKEASPEQKLEIVLARDGHVWQGDQFVPVRIEKQLGVQAASSRLPIEYSLTNTSDQAIGAQFGVEFCFGLLAGHSKDAYYKINSFPGSSANGDGRHWTPEGDLYLDSRGEVETKEIALANEFLGIEIVLKLGAPTRVWRMPIETISLSEAGFERVYQASCILLLWDVAPRPREKWQVKFEIELVAR